jgi:hypothetical protein
MARFQITICRALLVTTLMVILSGALHAAETDCDGDAQTTILRQATSMILVMGGGIHHYDHLAGEDDYIKIYLPGDLFGDEEVNLIAKAFPGMSWLAIVDNHVLTNQGLENFSRLSKLRWIYLRNSNADASWIPALLQLTSLEYLNISGTFLTDDDILRLAPLARLKAIEAYHVLPNYRRGRRSKITEQGAANLNAIRPEVDIRYEGRHYPSSPTLMIEPEVSTNRLSPFE